ncbi:hypothetical protein L2K70_10305 [Nocardioides KLBMP 9356]|uniref:Uncharacterized protein n=1 Tax=Nocardioides potassii TaxID=2911371 RepID=A0ABS9HCH1_9ACTN|nr:hypothetical protein [Nocardioides potassii]MCF6377997.1 hypothetical protein [Nocardioides potassii]
MTSLWIAAIGIFGTLAGSVVTQVLQARAADRRGHLEERRRVSDLRREALALFADALMSYRKAQLHNWHEAKSRGVDPDETDAAAELRDLRAKAWSAFYRVQLLWQDNSVVGGARKLVDAVTDLKLLDDKEAVGESADQVREDLSLVMDQGRDALDSDNG